MHGLPAWLEEFTEISLEGEASTPKEAGPREPSIPVPRSVVETGPHDVFTHLPKDRNCELRSEGLFAEKRTSDLIPRAEKFGDLKTA